MTELLWDVADWTVELVVQREEEREERREKKRGERREVEVDAAYLRHRARKWCCLSSTEVALSRLLSSDCNYVYRTFRTWTGGTQNSRSSYVSVDKVRKVQTLALLMSTFPLSYIPDMCMTCKPPLRYQYRMLLSCTTALQPLLSTLHSPARGRSEGSSHIGSLHERECYPCNRYVPCLALLLRIRFVRGSA